MLILDMFLGALPVAFCYAVYQAHGLDWALIFVLLMATARVIGRIVGADINHSPYEFIGLREEKEDA